MAADVIEPVSPVVADGTLTINAAVNFTGLGRTFFYDAMRRGEIRFVKAGQRRLIPRRELTRFLSERLARTSAD